MDVGRNDVVRSDTTFSAVLLDFFVGSRFVERLLTSALPQPPAVPLAKCQIMLIAESLIDFENLFRVWPTFVFSLDVYDMARRFVIT